MVTANRATGRPRRDRLPATARSGQPGYGPPPQGGYAAAAGISARRPATARQGQPGYGPPPGGGTKLDVSPAGIKAQYAQSRPPKQLHQAFLAVVGIFAVNALNIILSAIATAIFFAGYAVGATGIGSAIVQLIVLPRCSAPSLHLDRHPDACRVPVGPRSRSQCSADIGAIWGLIGVFGGLAVIGFFGLFGIILLLFSLVQLALCVAILVLMFRPASNDGVLPLDPHEPGTGHDTRSWPVPSCPRPGAGS